MIDLDRLREAQEQWEPWVPGEIVTETVEAVLDAPREYECNWSFSQPTEGCESGLHRTAGLVEGGRCGWVALVPITGEGR